MAKKKKWSKRDIPHCPDPENYVLVKTRESVFWRKKRAKGKVNDAFAINVDLAKICSPAARNIIRKLRPFMKGIDAGRITLRFGNALRRGLKQKKKLSLCSLVGEELQRDYPLHQLLLVPYEVIPENSVCRIKIGVEKNCVKKQNRIATHFYFEGLLLYGDPMEETSLQLESIESKLYAFGEEPKEVCELCLSIPPDGISWIVLLKVNCLEGNEIAAHPKHYGMKVVKVAG